MYRISDSHESREVTEAGEDRGHIGSTKVEDNWQEETVHIGGSTRIMVSEKLNIILKCVDFFYRLRDAVCWLDGLLAGCYLLAGWQLPAG